MEALAQEKGFAPDFAAFEAGRAGEVAWLAELRAAAFARFEELGFPTPKIEEWRFTGVGPIVDTPWVRADGGPGPAPPRGRGAAASLPEGVRITSLKEALARDPEALRAHLGKVAGFETNAFTALNTAFLEEGILVEIARGAVVEEPIEIPFASISSPAPAVSHPRRLVLAGESSQATLVETYAGEGRSFTNAVTEIVLDNGAVLEHYKVQREDTAACHVQTIAARQGRSSRFTSHNLALGAALARTDIHVLLEAEGAECELNGLFVGSGSQHLDTHTTIDHAKPHGVSRELYKGILDGKARGVFHGKIIVRPDAQKTDAMQTNKNLLLSREALVNSTPALEIRADDVKCKHGSTIGQLDASALFYLRSRGIGEKDARSILTYAFAADVTGRIRILRIREEIERFLGLALHTAKEAP